jgi:membrane-associated phospholipid phosphatase
MHAVSRLALSALVVASTVPIAAAPAQPDPRLAALEGLAPFSLLLSTPVGREALAANQRVTWDVQRGGSGRADGTKQPLLQPFPQQQRQALRDAFITSGNAYGLADGLGSGLAHAYRGLAGYASHDDGATATATGNLPPVAALLAYASSVTAADAAAAKYFFADGNSPDETTQCRGAAIDGAAAILARPGATTDVYGQAYLLPGGVRDPSPGADPCGNSRPFQTDHRLLMYTGADFWGLRSGNALYLDGPTQDLRSSPAFPSGHTTYGYTESVLLGVLVPRRYAQMVVRGAEYGNDRIVLGAHYPMDVLGGRTIALHDLAHLLANDPQYLNLTVKGAPPVADFRHAVEAARAELQSALTVACRRSHPGCGEDTGRFHDTDANSAFYESTQTYGLPVVNQSTAGATEDVSAVAPDAGYLLTAGFPKLSLKQADDILTATEGPGGGFLDTGGEFGVYSRIDLYEALTAAAKQGG